MQRCALEDWSLEPSCRACTGRRVNDETESVSLQGVYTKKVSVLPRPITPASFSDRIQAVDNVTSAAMYAALQGAHLLDLKDMLVQDPRRAHFPLPRPTACQRWY